MGGVGDRSWERAGLGFVSVWIFLVTMVGVFWGYGVLMAWERDRKRGSLVLDYENNSKNS